MPPVRRPALSQFEDVHAIDSQLPINDRRSGEIDVGTVGAESWLAIRGRLFTEHGVRDAGCIFALT